MNLRHRFHVNSPLPPVVGDTVDQCLVGSMTRREGSGELTWKRCLKFIGHHYFNRTKDPDQSSEQTLISHIIFVFVSVAVTFIDENCNNKYNKHSQEFILWPRTAISVILVVVFFPILSVTRVQSFRRPPPPQ